MDSASQETCSVTKLIMAPSPDPGHLMGCESLDKFRREIIKVLTLRPHLDAEALELHLSEGGLTGTSGSLMSPQVSAHAAFFRPGADPITVREGWRYMMGHIHKRGELLQRDQLKRDLEANMTPETWARFQALQNRSEDEDGADGGGVH